MRDDVHAAVTVCGERKARLNVVGGEVGEIVQHLGDAHAAAEIIENIGHSDARPADARLATADSRVNRDALSVIHGEGGFSDLSCERRHTERLNVEGDCGTHVGQGSLVGVALADDHATRKAERIGDVAIGVLLDDDFLRWRHL